MKITLSAHVYMERDFLGKMEYRLYGFDGLDQETFGVYVGPVSVDYEIPADFNPVAAQVKALKAKKAEALDAYNRTVAQINEQLSKLLAITHEG